MPPERLEINCNRESYFQYHNRIASFSKWNVKWEICKSKPSPERLARAGFFLYTTKPFLSDNVICPYCDLALDTWKPRDEPLRLHQRRSPDCSFVLGQQLVRKMDDASTNNLNAVAEPGATEKKEALSTKTDNTNPASRWIQRHTLETADVPRGTLQLKRRTSHIDKILSSQPAGTGPKSVERLAAGNIAGKNPMISKSIYEGLNPITRTPPLERQRQRLVKTHNGPAFDRFIYSQQESSQPPPGSQVPVKQLPSRRGNVFYGHVDPHIHWTRPCSRDWYGKKEIEISARGGRKANFGTAAQRMKERRLKEGPKAWEESLPERVVNNTAWLGVMRDHHRRSHHDQPHKKSWDRDKASRVAQKRPYRSGNPVPISSAVPAHKDV
jgi:hypothetical protein